MRSVEWMGLRLPKSHPVLSLIYPTLSTREREAVDAVEHAAIGMIRFHGKTAFEVGVPQGFSQWYRWAAENHYVARMTDADAAILFRGGILEYAQFRDIDRPDHARYQAPYPSEALMRNLRVQDKKRGVWTGVTPAQARIVARLLRRVDRLPEFTVTFSETTRIGPAFGPDYPNLADPRLRHHTQEV